MTRYFCMMLRKKDAKQRFVIRSCKPKFIRAQSGEFNFYIDEKRNHVSTRTTLKVFACCDAAYH